MIEIKKGHDWRGNPANCGSNGGKETVPLGFGTGL